MDHIIHYYLLNSTSHDNATIVSIFTVVIAYKICNLKQWQMKSCGHSLRHIV